MTTESTPKTLSGTKTEKNLASAYAGEAASHTRYELYAGAAYEDGLATVGDTFWNLSHQEKEHAELWADILGEIGDTKTNLKNAIASESYETESFYPEYARVAAAEGFDDIAEKFRMVGEIEKNHHDILKNTLNELQDGTLYGKAPENAHWLCTNCGYVSDGTDAPEICPVCGYPRGYCIRYDG